VAFDFSNLPGKDFVEGIRDKTVPQIQVPLPFEDTDYERCIGLYNLPENSIPDKHLVRLFYRHPSRFPGSGFLSKLLKHNPIF